MVKYSKKINIQKKFKKHPSTQSSGMPFKSITDVGRINSVTYKKQRYMNPMTAMPPAGTGATPTAFPVQNDVAQGAGQSNPFYIFLLSNSIARTTEPINTTGAVTGIDVHAVGIPSYKLIAGDYFYIYHPITFKSKLLVCDRDVTATTTAIRIPSTNFQKGEDNFPSGSFIVKKQDIQTKHTATAPIGSGSTAYIWYLASLNNWYSSSAYNLSLGTSVGSETDSTALRSCEYIATQNCVVTDITIAFYSNKTADLEFQICKVPLVNNSTSNVTLSQMTHTDNDGTYTLNTNYVKSFVISGTNNLTAGQGVAVLCRSTTDAAVRLYGRGYIKIV